ncbi:MAG: hypothetical protein JO219_06800 [Candidatus Eremiobacteraeota bacterium]|nr:hypothetical protein [Candidatus Eremiobacteraeota bacterium]
MKPVKTYLVAALCTLALAAPAFAFADSISDSNANPGTTSTQPAGSGQHRHGMGAMLKSLDLSPQQQEQIKTLIANYKQAHPEGSQPDPAAREQLHQQILNVLTPDQRTKLEQERAQWKQHHVQQGPIPSPSPQ